MTASGALNPNWRGGRSVTSGYVQVRMPEHERANRTTGYVLEHVLIAERALGHPLPPKAEVHHVDEDRTNNSPTNLVICEDHAYHFLLHRRARALAACGNANALRCGYCHSYANQGDITPIRKDGNVIGGYHRSCHAKYETRRRARAEARRNGEAKEPAAA